MDPTQDVEETRKLMASVKEAVDRIVEDYKYNSGAALPTDKSVRGGA